MACEEVKSSSRKFFEVKVLKPAGIFEEKLFKSN